MATQQEFSVKRIGPIAIIVAVVIFLIIFWSRMTVTINSGEAGVLFRTLTNGVDTEHTYGEGFHFLAPWNKMIVYNVGNRK